MLRAVVCFTKREVATGLRKGGLGAFVQGRGVGGGRRDFSSTLSSFSACHRPSPTSSSPLPPPSPTLKDAENYFLSLSETRPANHSLPAAFYGDIIHTVDIHHIWSRSWLMAGFSFQIPQPNDYITYKIGPYSIIITRGTDGQPHAYQNVCRHRGSLLCTQESGNTPTLVCPYHQWTYDVTTGGLKHARDMGDDFESIKPNLGLIPVNIKELHGFLFVCIGQPHFAWEECVPILSAQVAPHCFSEGKIAYQKKYIVGSDWKLVYENNRECYHCNKCHPEYIKANYDTAFSYAIVDDKVSRVPDPLNPKYKESVDYIKYLSDKWTTKLGVPCTSDALFPGEGWYRATRQPNRKGWPIESMDGQRVCKKRMGDFDDDEMGSMRVHTLPNHWTHASADHAVAARLTPISSNQTEVTAYWIVRRDAVEGVDYEHDSLTALWDITNRQDWKLSEDTHQGVMNPQYRPGPLSPTKEASVEKFLAWYLSNTRKMILDSRNSK